MEVANVHMTRSRADDDLSDQLVEHDVQIQRNKLQSTAQCASEAALVGGGSVVQPVQGTVH